MEDNVKFNLVDFQRDNVYVVELNWGEFLLVEIFLEKFFFIFVVDCVYFEVCVCLFFLYFLMKI